jgi:hypothetical protein
VSAKSVKERYRGFLNTPRGADIYRDFKRILYTSGDSLIQTLDTQILEHLLVSSRSPLRICDIGGGDGGRVLRIISFLQEKFHGQVELDFVEQSSLYVEEFKRRRPESICRFNIYEGLFEQAPISANKYDLVLLIHSIFAFESGDAVDKVLSLPVRHGKIVVVSNNPDSFLGQLKKLVDEGDDDQRYEIDDLQRELVERGIPFQEFRFATEWAISNQNWQLEIDLILEWISLGQFETFSPPRRKSILAYIESMTRKEGDLRFFSEDEVIMVLPQSLT